LIRAFAIDIDGTMTFKDRRLDLKAVEAVRRAEAADVQVILATGNILPFAEAAAIMLGTSGPIIAEDGGVVLDRKTGREHVLGDRVEANRGVELLRKEFGPLKHGRSSSLRLTGLTLERTIEAERATRVFRRAGMDLIALDSGFAIHIKDPSVNKGNALRLVASLLGVGLAEVAAMGDAPNDVEMLEVAGLSFAPANACEHAKRVSTHVTAGSYGEGVAEAVEKILEFRM